MRELEALYFPYASITDMAFLKSALLYFDKIWLISSHSAFNETVGEFGELLQDGELVQWINAEELAFRAQPVLENAISTDLSDNGFLSLTQKPGQAWEIYEDKGLHSVGSLIRPLESRGNKLVVPYEQGESFFINLALLAVSNPSKPLIPLADDEEHFSILKYKLRRGARGQLERLYGDVLERGQIEALISVIGRELVEAILPSPEQMENVPLARIKEFRTQYSEDRNKLRDRLFLMMEDVLAEEPTVSPARLQMRVETLVKTQFRRLQYERAWSTRILGGFKAVLGSARALSGTLKSLLTGAPIAVALASELPAAGEPVLNFIEKEISQLRTSDLAYLYRISGEFI
jgi:hypothetical protein